MIIINVNPKRDLVFNIKVHESCKSCKRYGRTGCCPPNIGEFDYYRKLLPQYKYGKLFIETFSIQKNMAIAEMGKESSLKLHRILLTERKKLFENGHYFNIILGGGSCKWCKKCTIPCKLPQFRAIPIEATGIDVVTVLSHYNVTIKFPVDTMFYRVGAILWD